MRNLPSLNRQKILLLSVISHRKQTFKMLTHAIDFTNALVTCVDAQLGNGRKVEVGNKAIFGVLGGGGPQSPAVRRYGFTTDLAGRICLIYSDFMQSFMFTARLNPILDHWLPNGAGGWMWSSLPVC